MKRLIALLLACTMLFALAGCATEGDQTGDKPNNDAGSGTENNNGGGTTGEPKVLKFAGVYPDMQVLDLMKSTTTDTCQAGSLVVEALLDFGDDFEIKPLLLTQMPTVSEDGMTFTCELKKGIRFHDGTELKASDVEFTYTRMFKPETICVNTFLCDMIKGAKEMLDGKADKLEGFQVIDDYNFTITLESPYSPFLSVLACEQLSIYPEKACTEAGDKWGVDVFIGTGPYQLKEFRPKDVTIVEKFADYHGEPVTLDGIEMYNMDQNTALLEYESGNMDIVGVNQDVVDTYRKDDSFKNQLQIIPLVGIISMNLNVTKAPLDNPKVREAVGYAVDQNALVDDYLHGNAQATGCFIPRGLIGYDESRPASKYDPAKAKQLLAEAGFPDGIHLVTTISEKSTAVGVATVLQQQMKNAGIEFEIQKVDDAAYIDLRKQGEVQVAFSTWYADIPDPDNFLYTILYSKNSKFFSSCYSNPEFDSILDECRTISDQNKRTELYAKAENMVVNQDFANVPLYNPIKFWLVQENVKDIVYQNSLVDLLHATKG